MNWSSKVEAPFRDDPAFWRAVALSVDAVAALVVVTAVYAFVHGAAAYAFALPVLLLVASALVGRGSTARSRPQFSDRLEWRDAERRAVAAALPGALLGQLRRG